MRQRVPAAVRAELESLLQFDGETAGAIQGRIAAAANAAFADGTDPAASTDITGAAHSAAIMSEIVEGRFPPGGLLAGRYRIISLVGRGGMGEVYRANDLKLKQPVALKFLPETASRDPRLLARFHGEVRLAHHCPQRIDHLGGSPLTYSANSGFCFRATGRIARWGCRV